MRENVAHAARRALVTDRQNKVTHDIPTKPSSPVAVATTRPDTGKKKRDWLWIALFLVVFITVGGESVKLTCGRAEAGGAINCIKQSKLLWIIPLGEKSISQVRGARLGESSYEDTPTYRVELVTTEGYVPVTSLYTSGYSTKKDCVDKINAFARGASLGPLVIAEPGLLSFVSGQKPCQLLALRPTQVDAPKKVQNGPYRYRA
jgi:hypothetical protein